MRARRLRALLAAGILLAVVVGAPVALLAAVGNPLPAALPSPEAIRLAIDSGNLSPHSLAKGLALVLWACWAYFTLTGAAAALDAIRHRSRPSLRLPSPSTRLVAVVAGALWFSTAPLELASAAALPTAVPVHLLATAATAPTPAPTPTASGVQLPHWGCWPSARSRSLRAARRRRRLPHHPLRERRRRALPCGSRTMAARSVAP